MCKENYFRNLIIKADLESDIVTVFNNLQNWSYSGIVNVDGYKYYKLVNIIENAEVLFKYSNSDFTMSSSVLPIKMDNKIYTDYRYGYDFSDNQPNDIRDSILFDLCKEIKNYANTNEIVLYCGIVPATND